MKTSKKFILPMMFVLILFMSISFISAFSISAPFMKDKELFIQPGETKDLQFVIQNGGGATSDIVVKVGVTEGSEIISLADSKDTYNIPLGQRATSTFRITLPADAPIGDSYDIRLSFNTVTGNVGGAFAFGSSIGQRFTVISRERVEPEVVLAPEDVEVTKVTKNYGNIIAIIIGIIIVLGIIYYLNKKKKLSNNKKNKSKKKI